MAAEPPRPSELSYLAELKTRFRELQKRQAAFMEQTAQMLTRMSSTAVGQVFLDSSSACPGQVDIKRLIRRFEDLRKTSEQLKNFQRVPEELINVDVRRLLKDYEKFIEEGNVLQRSWLRLRKSAESGMDLSETETLSIVGTESSKETNDSVSKESKDSVSKESKDSTSKETNDSPSKESSDSALRELNDLSSKQSKASVLKVSNDSSKVSKDSASKVSNDSSSKVSNDLASKQSKDLSSKESKASALKLSNDPASRESNDLPSNEFRNGSEDLLVVKNVERNCSKQKYAKPYSDF
ncbi:uncharacterized protein LOC6593277 isoform X2 [Drosophila persimilis]|uniref:uncharacterized protein LOC6593277 isoform X2 n=1 Tax=Drosophila persimilis TaxID=7234 RepID=UPI000F099FBA|nr:uncharacterized protein LOC6593277 isoform X2 [Drosophila persimilis]